MLVKQFSARQVRTRPRSQIPNNLGTDFNAKSEGCLKRFEVYDTLVGVQAGGEQALHATVTRLQVGQTLFQQSYHLSQCNYLFQNI